MKTSISKQCGFVTAILLLLTVLLSSEAAGAPLTPAVIESLDAVLECERPEGGWMYVCDKSRRIAGFTRIMRTAEQIAGAFGLANWDLIVLRSPGTPAAGLLLLQAYRATGQEKYLAAARRTGDLLVNLQLPSGGWFSEMPAYGNQLAGWFRMITPWATLDDDVTPGATRFLLLLWETTGESRYRDAAERGLDLLLDAQLSSGAWPLTWRPQWRRFLSPSFEDLPSLNDAATTAPIHTLLVAARVLDRPELLDAARRGGKWILQAQGAAPNAGWAQQYNAKGQPGPGRRFEPVALASWESRHALEALQALAEATGEQRFCSAFPAAIDWLSRSALSPGCWARYYSLDANTPVYTNQKGQAVASIEQAKRPYRWQGDFGIPALFSSLGLGAHGSPRNNGTPPSNVVWHLPGDAGACPGDFRSQPEGLRSLGPRSRILKAASRFHSLDLPRPAECSSFVSPSLVMKTASQTGNGEAGKQGAEEETGKRGSGEAGS